MSAPDDKTIVFRLKQPFPLLPDALGHAASNMCAIMPKHIAETDPFKQITEVIGSGPFRFKADERVQGALFVYERFDEYKPREDGEVSFTAGPKIVHFDRVEWHVQPDPATKAAAMQAGEMDWWENPTADLLPLLRKHKIATPIPDPTGTPVMLRPNHLYPPFDKPAVRRALLGAIDQKEFMIAIDGRGHLALVGAGGLLPAVSPLASDAGMSALTGKRDYAAVRRALESGRLPRREGGADGGDRPADHTGPAERRHCRYAEARRHERGLPGNRLGHGGAAPRADQAAGRGRLEPVLHRLPGLDCFTPASHLPLRGNGKGAWFGWPNDPKMEELREAWFNAPDLAARRRSASEMQLQAFENVPYLSARVGAAADCVPARTSPACRRASRSSGTCVVAQLGHHYFRLGSAPRPSAHRLARWCVDAASVR